MDLIVEACRLLETSRDLQKSQRWYLPFPMGVFGTLREGQWNNGRMHNGKVEVHKMAFMPHFVAHGLSISFRKNSSAPFEIFFYRPEEWEKIIGSVDSLEGFSPRRALTHKYGYYRTLAWLNMLPNDFKHYLFSKSNNLLDGERDLKIPIKEWDKYERVPCWVYSSVFQNEKSTQFDTIIWE